MSPDRSFSVDGAPPGVDERPGGDYNELPYPSMPFAYTQPAHLAALACLFGLETPAADRARVVELGCASGGNIIPLAARFPNARFVGIDLSQRQVGDGRKRVEALGLQNIEIRQGDLANVRLSGEEFDYVICHGVFSWVPSDTQDRILEICADGIAPNGLAAISYNVLPGWHLRRAVRDICIHHVGTEGTPRERVAGARKILAQIAEGVSDNEPYGLLLRREAERIAQLPASYVLGEFLAPDNHPMHFHEFVARTEKHGLMYLCEGNLASSISESLFPDTERRLRAMSGASAFDVEQYKDFFTGRPFRRSVLTKPRAPDSAATAPNPDRLRSLHLASPLQHDPSESDEHLSVYKDDRGRLIRAKEPHLRRALDRLADAYPSTCSLVQLIDVSADPGVEARVCHALFTLVSAGQATISTVPLRSGRAMAERPRVWPVARVEANAGQPWLTNLRHDAVALNPVVRRFAACVDGSRDRRDLRAQLLKTIRGNELGAGNQLPEFEGEPEAFAERLLEGTLRQFDRNALLEPE
jgi:trans-aconitate methyltransferase/methyltransferase-like protein